MDELYTKNKYMNPLYNYLISRFIREYDMKKSNISILFDKNIIDYETYIKLYNAPRDFRQVYIGKMILANPEIQKILTEGVTEYKEKLFKANNIQDHEVLSIKNDAIFIIDRPLQITNFGNIEFVNKNIYTSFYLVGKKNAKELYYFYDGVNNIEKLDVKGINDSLLFLHEDYMIEFLKTLFCTAETETLSDCIELLTAFQNSYKRLELDVEYYRRFDADCMYDMMKTPIMGYCKLPSVLEEQKQCINIQYNLDFLRKVNQIFSDIYLTQNKM